jgi:hypothetical protein
VTYTKDNFSTAYPQGGVTYEDLRAFFLKNLQASNQDDQTAFRSVLALLGYDPNNLVPARARRYNISFHSRAIEVDGDPL